MLTKSLHCVLAIIFCSFIPVTLKADDGGMMVKMLEGLDSAHGQEGQQYQAVVARDATISGVLVPKGTQAVVVLVRGVGKNAWTLQLAAVVLNGKILLAHGNSPAVVPMSPTDFLTMGKKTVSTPDRIAVAAGLTVRFSIPGPLTPDGATVTAGGQPPNGQPPTGSQPQLASPARHGVGNDMFADRFRLTGMDARATGDNRKATEEAGEAAVWPAEPDRSIWWEYTAPANGKVTFDTAGSGAEFSTLAVFVGQSIPELVPVRYEGDHSNATRVEFQAAAGQAYEIRNSGQASSNWGVVTLNVHLTPNDLPGSVVGSDNFRSRRTMTGNEAIGLVYNKFFTFESGEPPQFRGHGNTNSAWWTYTPPANGLLKIDALGTGPETTSLAIFVGDSFQSMIPLARRDAPVRDFNLQMPVTAGVAYQLQATTGDGGFQQLNLRLTPKKIANSWFGTDGFEDRPKVTGASAILVGNAAGTTIESGEPSHNKGQPNANTLWWSWTAPATGRVNIDGLGSRTGPIGLAAYTGTSLFGLAQVAQNFENPDKVRLDFPVEAGATYSIVVNGATNLDSNLTLHLTFYKPAPNPRAK
jgi:hypothetical protein